MSINVQKQRECCSVENAVDNFFFFGEQYKKFQARPNIVTHTVEIYAYLWKMTIERYYKISGMNVASYNIRIVWIVWPANQYEIDVPRGHRNDITSVRIRRAQLLFGYGPREHKSNVQLISLRSNKLFYC